ncbi:hypothetical protein XCCB100_0770 [Xanthomonas campestris pv. campestris]|uniref:Uncharacterized protein n=1 Tax=Xanthomonas campestris pv. campestris (strain B100) TaxID=509169 RepID=B0RNS6_XANCB|nr:hypothetical protein XCCB100_0770 [Xanthomonas campestris pv. campestris]
MRQVPMDANARPASHGGRFAWACWPCMAMRVITFFELTQFRRILSSDRNPETDVRFAARFALVE